MGRPRDPRVDEAIRTAVLELLVEDGYQATTIQAVARRAGVGAPSIYRRWSTKAELVEDAIFPSTDVEYPEPSGDFAADLRAWTRLLLRGLNDPAARAAIAGLLTEYHRSPAQYDRLVLRTEMPTRQAFRATIEAAVARGTIDADTSSDLIYETLLGAMFLRAMVRGERGALRHADDVAALVARSALAR
ncbi:MAG: TetR/AcrR family transcriptional regulator [Acidimicrobiales bacterium]|nr:TetR/AcrR family transcriptional regulator [Acidimicrobiales bacterium]